MWYLIIKYFFLNLRGTSSKYIRWKMFRWQKCLEMPALHVNEYSEYSLYSIKIITSMECPHKTWKPNVCVCVCEAGRDILELLPHSESYLTLSASSDALPVSPHRRIICTWKKEETHRWIETYICIHAYSQQVFVNLLVHIKHIHETIMY